MKKFNLMLVGAIIFVGSMTVQNVFAGDVLLQREVEPIVTSPSNRIPFNVPVHAEEDGEVLTLNFLNVIGIAEIKIVDKNESVVYQEMVNTDSQQDYDIPFYMWDSGSYKVKVVYGSVTLSGSFTIY